MPDTELTDSRGRPLHGRAKEVAQAAEVRRRAEAEELATVRAVARALVKLMARGSLSGPDALRNLVGRDDTLRILRMAGLPAEQAAASWQAEAAPRQVTTQLNGGYSGDPDHDERVLAVMRRPGSTIGEIAAVRRQVTEEYASIALAAEARRREYYGHDRMPAAMGAAVDERGVPVQRSVVHHDVPELGSEA